MESHQQLSSVNRFGIIGHNVQTGCENVNLTENVTNDEVRPSTPVVLGHGHRRIEHHLTVPLCQTLKEKSLASAKCNFLHICLVSQFFFQRS